MGRERLQRARRWVVKIGSSLVTANGRGLDRDAITGWSAQLAALHADGAEVVLVSSGAVAEGMSRLGWRQRPHALHELQAAAAVGQMGLVQAFESAFRAHGIGTAHAFRVNSTAGAFSGIGMGLNALLTAFLAPLVVALLL